MDAGDSWRCKLKILYENSWVPQKCGNRKQVPQVPQCGIKCGTMCGNMLLSFLLSAQIFGRFERSAQIGR